MLKRLNSGVPSLISQISLDLSDITNTYRKLPKFRDYILGRQDSTLTLDQQRILEGVLGNDYCDNLCKQIVSEHSDRLELQRITCKDDKVQKWIADFWQKAKWDDLQQRTHRKAIAEGNFCLMVDYDYDNKKICIHRYKWYDGSTGVFVGYDTYGKMLYAVREWDTPAGRRRTVYYDGVIERYIASGNTWFPFLLPSDTMTDGYTNYAVGPQKDAEDSIPIPYTDANGNPLHVPFVHFVNPGDEYDNYGTSILDGGLIGKQDIVNDNSLDIAAAARMTAFQRTWSKGYRLEKINGKTVRPKTGPGTHYHSDTKDADWGVLAAGDMTQLIEAYNNNVKSFCRQSNTPYASITGNWPSGEAVYKLEQPIRGDTKGRQKRLTPAWVETMHRSIELANAIDNENLDEDALLTAIFTDAGDRDPLTEAMSDLSFWQAAVQAVTAGFPLALYLKVNGWGETEYKGISVEELSTAIEAEREKKNREQTDLVNATATAKSKANGNNNPTGGKGGGSPSNPSKGTQQTAKKQG